MLNKMKEKICITLAWWMPRELVYWCALRLMTAATVGRYGNTSPTELTCMDALKRWEI